MDRAAGRRRDTPVRTAVVSVEGVVSNGAACSPCDASVRGPARPLANGPGRYLPVTHALIQVSGAARRGDERRDDEPSVRRAVGGRAPVARAGGAMTIVQDHLVDQIGVDFAEACAELTRA